MTILAVNVHNLYFRLEVIVLNKIIFQMRNHRAEIRCLVIGYDICVFAKLIIFICILLVD